MDIKDRKQAVDNLVKWYSKNLPKTTLGKFVAKRFEVNHPQITEPIVINRKFYDEIIGRYVDDPSYIIKLELAKHVHKFLPKSELLPDIETSVHHSKAVFFVFKSNYSGIEIEFKVKKDSSGYFLHYMRIL